MKHFAFDEYNFRYVMITNLVKANFPYIIYARLKHFTGPRFNYSTVGYSEFLNGHSSWIITLRLRYK